MDQILFQMQSTLFKPQSASSDDDQQFKFLFSHDLAVCSQICKIPRDVCLPTGLIRDSLFPTLFVQNRARGCVGHIDGEM
jgi:hypothetical protein